MGVNAGSMKLTQLALVALAFTGAATTSLRAADTAAAGANKETTFKVSGMMCSSCENSVKSAVTKVDGVKSIEADSDKGTAVVAYDPAKTSDEKIAAAINATKFKVAK